MNKPHIRKTESTLNGPLWHCSFAHGNALAEPGSSYWHTYGATWRIAYDKMEALIQKHRPAYHGPSNA